MDSPDSFGNLEPVLILGLGNSLVGDDGVGPRVIQELRARNLPPGVVVAEGGTAGLGLINLLEGYQRAIIVDAVDMDQSPGQIARFTPHEARLNMAQTPLSPHQLGIGDTLALAQTLGMDLPDLVIVGIQPGQMALGEGLSPDVEKAIPHVVRAVLWELAPANSTDLSQ